jgi:hypothetical protein
MPVSDDTVAAMKAADSLRISLACDGLGASEVDAIKPRPSLIIGLTVRFCDDLSGAIDAPPPSILDQHR